MLFHTTYHFSRNNGCMIGACFSDPGEAMKQANFWDMA